MKQVLVLGAGQSSPYLIHRLLDMAVPHDWQVTVGDLDAELARERVGDHPRGRAILFDVTDEAVRSSAIAASDVVINMLSPTFQDLVAWDCVAHGRHMLSVSYRDRAVRDLDRDARRKGVLLLCELGLDPGIDHMSAVSVIRRVKAEGGIIRAFRSYGSGIPAPGQETNPLRYVVTWNPRNVVMASEHGAQYMEAGKIKLVPWHHVFHHTWPVEVEGVGTLEAYPNRDSVAYRDVFGLDDVHTMIRGTLRYPGWSETWARIVQLGIPNEDLRIPHLCRRTYREVTEMFLPMTYVDERTEERVARFLHISPTGAIMEKLTWLGIFSDEVIGCHGDTPAAMLIHLLQEKLAMRPDVRDMVILRHELEVEHPGREDYRVTSTLLAEGEPGGFTAMARTVGLPVAVATRLLLTGELDLAGSVLPTHPSLYEPVLRAVGEEGMAFEERRQPLAYAGT
ncbi:MAG: saccharopine dehydrogenase C-terminal domain-containing protein [Gemmatimonadota bacterium]